MDSFLLKTVVLSLLVFVPGWSGIVVSEEDTFPKIFNSESENHLTPMPAAQAAESMQLPPGFKVQVFAAEPYVQNPIAMAWDQKNRLWIAENYTYSDKDFRFDLTLRDRVLIFEDTDYDGKADSRKVFTDKVQMLTSVEAGQGGVWLMCCPQLLFIPDADGNDIPDGPPQVMLDGFEVAKESYHNFANGLRWGPDGWLYGRCGHSCPGKIGVPGTPDAERIPIEGGIWRFHPARKIFEVLCHGTTNPWGHDWDQHGELFFVNTVIGHLWHVMPGAHFKESFGESINPGVYERMDMIADHYHFDTKGSWTNSREGAANQYGGGHAHIGCMIYQGDRWPEQFRNKLYTVNQHGMRVNTERLERIGAGYVGKHEPDFLISKDPFFRSLDLSIAPDGNVMLIDWSDTGECHERSGIHRLSGRIYKISYSNSPTASEQQPLHSISKPYCLQGNGKLPQLWRKYQAGQTTPQMLLELLEDADEHVRVWAIRLLTDFWPLDTILGPRKNAVYPTDPAILEALIRHGRDDESGLVKLVLASTLMRLPVEHRVAVARELLQQEQYAHDRDLPYLVWYGLIPVAEKQPESCVELLKVCNWPQVTRWMTRNIAGKIESHPQLVDNILSVAVTLSADLQQQVLLGMGDAFNGWRKAPQPKTWPEFIKTETALKNPDLVRELNILFGDGRALTEIRKLALDKKAEIKSREKSLETLIAAKPDDLQKICESLIGERPINTTALKGLMLFNDPKVGRLIAQSYKKFPQEDRPYVLESLVSRKTFALELLNLMGQKNSPVPVAELNAFHARQIRSLGDEELNQKLTAVWGELRESPAERKKLIEETKAKLKPELLAKADLSQGRLLFNKTCSQCHMLYGQGQKIGPDLTGAQRSNIDYLLENMLDPSAVVNKDYRMSVLATVDGRVISGLVINKTEKTITVQTQTKQEVIPVEDILESKISNQSPMPDGLLTNLTQEQIVNLMGYLQGTTQVDLPK